MCFSIKVSFFVFPFFFPPKSYLEGRHREKNHKRFTNLWLSFLEGRRCFTNLWKDTLFDLTLVRLLLNNAGLVGQVVARLLLSEFREDTHLGYLITLACLQQESCRIKLARIPHLLMFPFSNFASIDHWPWSLAINFYWSLLYSELNPTFNTEVSLLPLQSFLNEICFYCFNYWPALVLLST